MSFSLPQKHTWLFDVVLLTLIIGIVYFIALGTPPLYITDEGRYAEIGREMLLLHSFITPHLQGLPYFEKPILSYWLIAGFEWMFGFSEWAVRSVNAVLGILSCLMVYTAGRLCFNRLTGIWAAFILSSSVLFFAMSHLLTTDMTLSSCLTLALMSFITWFKLQREGRSQPILLYIAYAACALAVLAKGLIGMVFPGMIVIVWLLFTWNWKLLKKMHVFTGLLVFLVIVLPWHLLAQHQNPTFVYEYFYVNHYLRYVTPIMHREMDRFVYLGVFISGFSPWMVLLIARFKIVLREFLKPRQHPVENFLILWIMSIFLFFGFSNSVLAPYLLPTLPPLALLTAPFVVNIWNNKHRNRNRRPALIATLIISWVLMIVVWINAPLFIHKSTKPLAETVNTLLLTHPTAILLNYNYYYQDFPFYTQHFVQIANWQDELTYGQRTDPAKKVLISDQDFWNLVKGPQTVYVVMNQGDFNQISQSHPNTLFLLGKSGRYVLVSNVN